MAVFKVPELLLQIVRFCSDDCCQLAPLRLVHSTWSPVVEEGGRRLRVAQGAEFCHIWQLSQHWQWLQILDLSNMETIDFATVLQILSLDRTTLMDHPPEIVALPTNVGRLLETVTAGVLRECCRLSPGSGQTVVRALLQAKNPRAVRVEPGDLVRLISLSTITDLFLQGTFSRRESSPGNVLLRFIGHWSDQQLRAFLYNGLLFDDVAAIVGTFSHRNPSSADPFRPLPPEVLCGALQLTGGVGLKALMRYRRWLAYDSAVPDGILHTLHVTADLQSGLPCDGWGQRFHGRASSASSVQVHPFARLWHELLTAHRVEELEGMEEEELWNRVFHESSFLGHVAAWRDFSHAAARLLFDLKRFAKDTLVLAFEAEEDHFLLRNADRVEELWASLGDPLKGRLRECMGASLPALLSCFESNDHLRVVVRLLVREMQARRVEKAAFMNAILEDAPPSPTGETQWQHAIRLAREARRRWYRQPRWRRSFYRLWTPSLLGLKEGFEALLYGSAAQEADLHLACRRNLIPPLLRDHAAGRHSLCQEEDSAWQQLYFREYFERVARQQGKFAAGLRSLEGA